MTGVQTCALPILFIGSEENEAARIVLEAGCGLIVPASDPAAFVSAVRKFVAEPRMGEEMGRRGREFFERNFTRDAMVRRFGEVLDEVAFEPGLRRRTEPTARNPSATPPRVRRIEALAESGARD